MAKTGSKKKVGKLKMKGMARGVDDKINVKSKMAKATKTF